MLDLGEAVVLALADSAVDGAGTAVRLPAEAMLRLVSGRLKPPSMPSSVSVEGQLSLDDLRSVFPGF